MPLHNLPINLLRPTLNHIAMAGNNPLKPPTLNPLHTLRKTPPIPRAGNIPQKPLLPERAPHGILHTDKQPRQEPRGRALPAFRILLGRGQIEHQIGFDQGAVRFVEEDELFVRVAVDVFDFELGIEVCVDAHGGLVRGGPGVCEIAAAGWWWWLG